MNIYYKVVRRKNNWDNNFYSFSALKEWQLVYSKEFETIAPGTSRLFAFQILEGAVGFVQWVRKGCSTTANFLEIWSAESNDEPIKQYPFVELLDSSPESWAMDAKKFTVFTPCSFLEETWLNNTITLKSLRLKERILIYNLTDFND